MPYDPVICGTERAAGTIAPTNVDDMALFTKGPRKAEYGFLAAVARPGRRIGGRTCCGTRLAWWPGNTRRALGCLTNVGVDGDHLLVPGLAPASVRCQ